MSSIIDDTKQSNQAIINKAKAMAVKYQKYCQTKQANQASDKVRCIQKWVKKANNFLSRAWNVTMPIFIRGPSTPYEVLVNTFQKVTKNEQQNIPFSQLTVTQAAKLNRINLLITYTQNSILETLQKINNNQQINSLINKKSEILPIKIGKPQLSDQITNKLREMIEGLGNNYRYDEHVFVIWKGLYQEILVIAHFQLGDAQLCGKTLAAIQERQDYQELVRKFANRNYQIYEQSSMNKFSDQSTDVGRQIEN